MFQIYKEAFIIYIEAFKTYKPLLTDIYITYENAIEFYKIEVKKLKPIKVLTNV